jgi:hypothetical protein
MSPLNSFGVPVKFRLNLLSQFGMMAGTKILNDCELLSVMGCQKRSGMAYK